MPTPGYGRRMEGDPGPERPSERSDAPGPVEDVITTAIALVAGRLAPREAVTILATLTPTAVSVAPRVRERHPDQAASRAAILISLAREVDAADDDARQRQRVVGDLMAIARALGHLDIR